MKTIAFHLQKGGVGKTSLSVSVAVELAAKGRTVLLDVDPQGNASSWLLTAAPRYELAAVLYGRATLAEAVTATGVPGLDIVPTFGIGGELKTYGENQLANEPFIFCDLVEELARLGYAFAVFDLSPGMGRQERAAIISADEIITPMTPEAFSLDGLEIFADELNKAKKAMRRGPEHRRIIVNAYNETIGQHNEILAKAEAKLKGYALHVAPVDPAYRKAQAANIPIQSLKGKDAPKPSTLSTLAAIAGAVCH